MKETKRPKREDEKVRERERERERVERTVILGHNAWKPYLTIQEGSMN